MKKTRAGKVVSKLVRKSHDVVVGNRAGALEKRWRDLLEFKGGQEVMQEEGTTASTVVVSPSTVSYLQQEPVASKRHPPKTPTSTAAPPRSINLVEDSSSSTSRHQRPPLVVAKSSPKLDTMALLEDVMLPRSNLSPRPFSSPPQSTESSSGVHSSERQAAVSQGRPTAQSGLYHHLAHITITTIMFIEIVLILLYSTIH